MAARNLPVPVSVQLPDLSADAFDEWSEKRLVEWLETGGPKLFERASHLVGLALWHYRRKVSDEVYTAKVEQLATVYERDASTLRRWRADAQKLLALPAPDARSAGRQASQPSTPRAKPQPSPSTDSGEKEGSAHALHTANSGEQNGKHDPIEAKATTVPNHELDLELEGSDGGVADPSPSAQEEPTPRPADPAPAGGSGSSTADPDPQQDEEAPRPSSAAHTPLNERKRIVRLIGVLSVADIREVGLGDVERMVTKAAAAAGGVFVLRDEFDKMRAAQRKVADLEQIIRTLEAEPKPPVRPARTVRPRDGQTQVTPIFKKQAR
jgi:hypothetical protein